ncbi:MAG: hypothetical protein Q9191_004762 [Dirinaria sp. TL-2023a]
MGQFSSKPPPSSTEHVFSSETPVRFSQDLLNALEASPETNSTRFSDLELHIQRRVAAELERLSNETSQQLSNLADSISAETPFESYADSGTSAILPNTKEETDKKHDLGRQSVQKEIDELKRKLRQRRVKEEVVGDERVEGAKESVVKCLKENDRRPLDCWKEVETFKKEVGRLEKGFLGRVWD